MFEARQDLEKAEGARLTLDEIGRRVAEEEGKDDPYSAPVVQRWIEGQAHPRTMATWRALAAVLNVRLGWLANGELPIRDEGEGEQPAERPNRSPPKRGPTATTPANPNIYAKTIPVKRRRKRKPDDQDRSARLA